MGFSQIPRSESDTGSCDDAALIALQTEFDEYRKQSSVQKQSLIEQNEGLFSSLRELLLNQAREVERVQNKVAGMKARVTGMENGDAEESDIHARLALVEQSLFDLRTKYTERAKLAENVNGKLAGGTGNEDLGEAESGRSIDPKVLRNEIATLQNLQVIVSNFYSQLFDSKTEADYQLEVATAYEKLAVAEKQKAATQQAFVALRAEFDGHMASAASARKGLLAEKEDSYACLKQTIMLQLRDAQAVSSKLSQIKEKATTDDEVESAAFAEMKVRIKLTETALMALLREHEEKGKVLEAAKASSDVETDSIDFSTSLAKVRRLREVLGYLNGQLKAAEASQNEKIEALTKDLRTENEAFQKEISELRSRLPVEDKQQMLEEKENACYCLIELIRCKKKDAEHLRAQLGLVSERSHSSEESLSGESTGPKAETGLNEMETRLKLVERALMQICDKYEEATKKISEYKARNEENPSAPDDFPDVPDFKTHYAKVQSLGRIVSILQSQQNTMGSEVVAMSRKVEGKQPADEKLKAMRQHFQEEKEAAFACLTEMIALKQGEAQLIRTNINKLKERKTVGVEEMETRLGLVDDALSELRVECDDAVKAIEEENENPMGNESDREIKPSSAKESLAKLNQLRGIMCFIRAQLNAAMFDDDSRRPLKVEKATTEKLSVMREQLLEEKENACSCMMELVQVQINEAQLARSKITMLKEKKSVAVEEMETRLRLVDVALLELQGECEDIGEEIGVERTSDSDDPKPTNAQESLAKLGRLRGILSFLNSHLDSAILSEEEKRPPSKTDGEKLAEENLNVMRQKFLSEKNSACACLMNAIKVQEDEARIVRSKVDVLKEAKVCVDEMETRLKLVEVALYDLRSSCEGFAKEIDEESNVEANAAKTTNAHESLGKLNRLAGILSFLNSHLDAAILSEANKRPSSKTAAEQEAEEKLNVMQQKYLSEKNNTCSCLTTVISVQENEARIVRSKIDKLKEANVGVDEMETRLKLVEVALGNLRSSCELSATEIGRESKVESNTATTTNAQASLEKLNRLAGILSFLNSQLDAAILSDTKTIPAPKTAGEKQAEEKLNVMRQKFLREKSSACSCLMNVISVQENEAKLVRSKVDKLKEAKVGVDEMETRLKLVEVALCEMRSSCEASAKEIDGESNVDANQAKPTNAEESLTKLNRLGGILTFLNSLLDAALLSESKNIPATNTAEKVVLEKLNVMRQKFLNEKESACSYLMNIISVQENEAKLVRSKVEKLKEAKVDVDEMETRLKLAEVALCDLRSSCELSVKEDNRESNVDFQAAEPNNAQEKLAKVNQLAGILRFLNSHLDGAMLSPETEHDPPSTRDPSTTSETLADEKFKIMREKFLNEKNNVYACLMTVIKVQENDARIVRSKVDKLKEAKVRVEFMETRLKQVEASLGNLRYNCEMAVKEIDGESNIDAIAAKPTNAQENLTELIRLAGILALLNPHLDAYLLAEANKRETSKSLSDEQAEDKLKAMRQKFLSEKSGACSCLMNAIRVHEKEARIVRSKVDKLKGANIDVDEMETRLKLTEVALRDLRTKCESDAKGVDDDSTDDADAVEPTNTQECMEKLNRLGEILSFLHSHIDGAILSSEAEKRPSTKTATEKPADEPLNAMRQKFLSEKNNACSCLMTMINIQENEARNVRCKIDKLKEAKVGVDEMETRLKLVEVALGSLRSSCELSSTEIEEESNVDANAAKPTNAQASLEKLNRLAGILSFLNSHLDAAVLSETKTIPAPKTAGEKQAEEKLIAMRQKFLSEKSSACSCLMNVISVKENEAKLVRSKVDKLKEAKVSVDEMETRLKLVEVALCEMRSSCEASAKEIDNESNVDATAAKPTNAEECLTKLNRLGGILTFLNSILDPALLSEAKKLPVTKTTAEKQADERLSIMRKKFMSEKESACSCLISIITVQENEAKLVRSKVDKLKKAKVGVDEMETRLNLAEVALREMRASCELSAKEIYGESNVDAHAAKTTNAQESLAKLNRLGGILSFLNAHLDAAILSDAKSRPSPKTTAEKQIGEKFNEMQQKFLNERGSACDCLLELIRIQEIEANHARSKVDKMKESGRAGVEEMDARLKLAEVALRELRVECEETLRLNDEKNNSSQTTGDGHASRPSNARDNLTKLNRLRGILCFLCAQLNAATSEDEECRLRKQKQRASGFLSEIIAVQEEAGLVQSNVEKLKKSGTCVNEIETRLKLAGGALQALRSEIEGESSPDIQKVSAKLNQLRGIVVLLHAQVDASMPKAVENRSIKDTGAIKIENADEVPLQLFLEEKGNACTCLLELIAFLEREAQVARSKAHKLKEQGCNGLDEMETRLRLAEVALVDLRSATGKIAHSAVSMNSHSAKDAKTVQGSDAREILGKLNQLRGIIRFIDAQMSAVMSDYATKEHVKSKPKSLNTARHSSARDEQSVFGTMNELMRSQYEELARLRAAIERKNSFAWATIVFLCRVLFYGSLLASAVYLVRGWEISMTPFNIVCSPALPGARITEHSGIHVAPFWVPKGFKNIVFEKVCSDVPRIQLEVKDQNFIVTEVDPRTKTIASMERKNRKDNSFFAWDFGYKPIIPMEKIRRYPAKFAYITLSNILTVDSDGWHELPLPWSAVGGGEPNDEDSGRPRYPKTRRY